MDEHWTRSLGEKGGDSTKRASLRSMCVYYIWIETADEASQGEEGADVRSRPYFRTKCVKSLKFRAVALRKLFERRLARPYMTCDQECVVPLGIESTTKQTHVICGAANV
jgi:hypothetical protein